MTEPNLESPLNSYAAALWNDKEGLENYFLSYQRCFCYKLVMIYIAYVYLSRSPVFFI